MNDPTVDPQQALRSKLPSGVTLIVVFVPSLDRDSMPIEQDYWVDEVLTTLGNLFRGATAYPRGKGVWRDDDRGGVLVREEPVLVFSYVAPDAFTMDSFASLASMLRRLGRETNQGEVGVVIDGQYYGITDYSEP